MKKKIIRKKAGKQIVKKLLPSGNNVPKGMRTMTPDQIRKALTGREGSTSQVIDGRVVSKGLKKKKPSSVLKKTKSPTKRKGATLMEGSGMGSQPEGGPRVIVGRSEEPTMKAAVTDKQKDSLARQKAAKESFDVSKKLKPGSRAALQDEFQKLTPSAKRFEAIKFIKTGKPSKYTPLFKKPGKKLTPAELKPKSDKSILALVGLGGAEYLSKKYQENKKKKKPVVKRKTSGPTKPKVKTPDWMKGLSPAQIQEIKGGPLPSGYRSGKKIKKKPSKVRKAKAGGPVVKRYGGGKVIKSNRSGNDVVAGCYD